MKAFCWNCAPILPGDVFWPCCQLGSCSLFELVEWLSSSGFLPCSWLLESCLLPLAPASIRPSDVPPPPCFGFCTEAPLRSVFPSGAALLAAFCFSPITASLPGWCRVGAWESGSCDFRAGMLLLPRAAGPSPRPGSLAAGTGLRSMRVASPFLSILEVFPLNRSSNLSSIE